MAEEFPYRDRLREQLVSAQSRKSRPSRFPARIFTVAAAMVILIAGTTVVWESTRPQDASAGVLSVVKSGDVTTVRLEDLKARPEQIEKELDDAGIKATVAEVPVAQPNVGYLFSFNVAQGFEPIGSDNGAYREFKIHDSSLSSQLELNIGRNANPDEDYAVAFNAYAPGGPLHCSGVFGKKASDVQSTISSLNLNVDWRRVATAASSNRSLTPQEINDGYIGAAGMPRANALIIQLAPKPTDIAAPPAHVGAIC